MSFGLTVGDICRAIQLASHIHESFAHYRTRPKEFELFSSEIATLGTTLLAVEKVLCSDQRSCSEVFELLSSDITTLRKTLLAVEQVLSSYSQAPLKGINFVKQAATDDETKLKQALGILKRYGNFTPKEGSRIKDRPRNRVWEIMERLQEEIQRIRQRMEILRQRIEIVRGRMEILQNPLSFRTSPILVEGLVDRLFTVRVDHQCDPITHGMQKPCTAIVLAPNGSNTHTSGDKGFCGTFIETILNGDLLLILATCLATLQKHLGPRRDFVKYLMVSCKTTAPPRPDSGPERPCWGPQANPESRTRSQHSAFPSPKLQCFLHRIRKGFPFNTSSLVVLLSPLLFAPSVGASEPGCVSTCNGVSWAQALRSTQTDLISVSPSSLSPPSEAHSI